MNGHKLSISQVSTPNWDFSQDVEGYRAAGIEALAVWRDKLDLYGQAEGLALLADSGLKESSISDAGYFLRKTHAQSCQAIEDTLEAINLASSLRAESLVIITGVGGSVFRSAEQDRQIVVQALREVGPAAEACGVKLALEAVNGSRYPGNTFLSSIPDVLKLLDEIRSPAVGLCFDFDHLWEEPDLKTHIADARGRIFAVHVCDMPRQPKPPFDRRLLGEGEAPLGEILSALVDADYKGYFDLEIFSPELWARDYSELINLSQEAFTHL